VLDLSIKMAVQEGLDKEGRVVTQGDIYFGKLADFAMHNCTIYECFKCQDVYFGGMQDCMQAMQSEDNLKKEDLLCKPCQTKALGFGSKMCKKHGNEFIDWKCMFCCSIALFYCEGGRGHYCTPCHNDAMAGKKGAKSKCVGGDRCPLGMPKHPVASCDPKLSAYPLGCSLCRSEKLAMIANNDLASAGVNIELRSDMIKRFDHVKGHGLEREMKIEKGAKNVAAAAP